MNARGFLLLSVLILAAVSLSGCTQDGELDINASDIIVCNKPYIRVGAECCLDQNSNAICDRDEAAPSGGNATTGTPDSGTPESPDSGTPSDSGPETPPGTTEPEANVSATCEPPEIVSGSVCCLDEDYNGACDSAEGMVTVANVSMVFMLPRAVCGDGSCFIGENTSTCPRDCGCPAGLTLYNNSCTTFAYMPATGATFRPMEICGNGVCNKTFESQVNCCKDCGCPSGKVCSSNNCTTISIYTPSLSPVTAFYDTYIVVTIDSLIIHDDTDPAGPGELMLFTYAGSGDSVQKLNWPYRIWYEVSGGTTIAKRIPVFALKEGEMGDNLAVSVTAIDNDQMPGWLETILDVLLAPVYLITTITETVGESVADLELQLGGDVAAGLADAVHGNERIGAVNKVYLKSDNWGVSGTQYSVRGGDLTVKYSIQKVSVPRNSRLGVKVYNVTFSDTGDYYDGEVFMYVRGAANYGEKDLSGVAYRFPEHGTWDLGDNAFIHSGACTPDGSGGCPENPLFSYEENGPFIFIELGGWDEDNPDAGDDHDSIGTLSYLFTYSDFDKSPATTTINYEDRTAYPWIISGKTTRIPIITRGNMKANYELYRYTG